MSGLALIGAHLPRLQDGAQLVRDGSGSHVPEQAYLVLAAVLFSLGAFGLLVRRNVLVMFMCVELMLNAVNLTFVTFAKELDDINGQAITFFTLVVAAAETVIGLGIIVAIFRRRREGATADTASLLRG